MKKKLILIGLLVVLLVGYGIYQSIGQSASLGGAGGDEYIQDSSSLASVSYVASTTDPTIFTLDQQVDEYDKLSLCMAVTASSTNCKVNAAIEVSHNNSDWFPLDDTHATTTYETIPLTQASSTYSWIPGKTATSTKCITLDNISATKLRVVFSRGTTYENYTVWAHLRPFKQ